MVFVKIPLQIRNVEVRLKAVQSWEIAAEDKKAIPLFLKDLSIGKVNLGHKISNSRQLKYLDSLKVALTHLQKSSSKFIVKDIENLDIGLSTNQIHRTDGKPFAEETKAEIKRFLRIYLKWKLRDDQKRYFELTSWLDTKVRKQKTPEFLAEAEIVKLFDACRDATGRFLVAVLFDSGARAEEFYNIRLEDVERPSGNRNYYRIHLKEEYSKTKGRVVPLFWEKSAGAMDEYLKIRIAEGIKPGDRLYAGTYDAMRFFLKRLGAKVLSKRVYPHLLRHSSATYYASKLNRQQLCKRYGWTFSSDMPDVYINRAGIDEAEMEEKFSQTELGTLKSKLDGQERQAKMVLDRLSESEKCLAAMGNQIKEARILSLLLKTNPSFREAFRKAAMTLMQDAEVKQTERQRTIA